MTFKACLRSDRHVKPEIKEYEFLTLAECKNLASESHCQAVGRDGKIASVKITSVKTWKTRSDVQVNWKFGLYEYGHELITEDSNHITYNSFFVREVIQPDSESFALAQERIHNTD